MYKAQSAKMRINTTTGGAREDPRLLDLEELLSVWKDDNIVLPSLL
jgi:hypothetical protein